MHQALLAVLTARLAPLPDWAADVLDDGVLPLLEWLAGEEPTGTQAQRHRTALMALNGHPSRLAAVCAADERRAGWPD